MEIKELKVSKNTDPKKLAGTIKCYLEKGFECDLLSLGSQSIVISTKSIALLSSMFGVDYNCKISYFNQRVEKGSISGIKFVVTS